MVYCNYLYIRGVNAVLYNVYEHNVLRKARHIHVVSVITTSSGINSNVLEITSGTIPYYVRLYKHPVPFLCSRVLCYSIKHKNHRD